MADKKPQMPKPPANFEPKHFHTPESNIQTQTPGKMSEAMRALEEKRQSNRRKKRIQIFVVIGLVIAIAIAGAVWALTQQLSNKIAEQAPTEQVIRGDYTKTISANGALAPLENQSVSISATGTIKTVNVAPGDKVQKGDVLATYESPDLEKAITQAEMGVKQAQNGVAQAKQGVSSAVAGYNAAVEQYNASVRQAAKAENEAALMQAKSEAAQAAQQAAAQAQAAQAAAIGKLVQDYKTTQLQKQSRDNLVAWKNLPQSTYDLTYTEVDKIMKQYQDQGWDTSWAKKEIERLKNNPDNLKVRIPKTLPDGTQDYLVNGVDDLYLTNILRKSHLVSMGIDPDSAQSLAAGMGDLGSSQAPEGPAGTPGSGTEIPPFDKDSNMAQVNTAKLGVTSANLALENANIALKEAKEAYNEGKIIAQIDGEVQQINVEPGTKIESLAQSGKPIMQIADVTQMKATMNVNEIDILKVTRNLVATMTFPAVENYEAKGEVTQIASSPLGGDGAAAGAAAQAFGGGRGTNIVSYPVSILLNNPDPRLKVGMSTSVTLTIEEYKNVLMVPLVAVNNDGEKDYVNKVTYDSKGVATTEKVYVKVISSNENYSVIEGNIAEGDNVQVGTGGTAAEGDNAKISVENNTASSEAAGM